MGRRLKSQSNKDDKKAKDSPVHARAKRGNGGTRGPIPKTIRTPEIEAQILDGLRSGLWYKQAAILAGVEASVARNWKDDGEKYPHGPHGEWVLRVSQAIADAERTALAGVDPEWWLARRFRKRYAPPVQRSESELSGPGKSPIQVQAQTISVDEATALLASLQDRRERRE